MSDAPAPSLILTADPDFLDLALRELEKIAPGAERLDTFGGEAILLALPGSFWELAEAWRQEPPIFVRHVNPVQATRPLPAGLNAVHALRALAAETFGEMMDPTLPFSVQTRLFCDVTYKAYDVNTALAQSLAAESGAPLDVRAPQQIVSVVIAVHRGQTTGLLGLSPAVYNLSDWAGGKRRFAREREQISRAEFKLLEALEVFDVPLPERGVALDLGAAPGGWTRVLRQKGQYVTAVDPGRLHQRLEQDPNVRHQQMTAEAYLESGPDQFDLILNDMRLDARDSARLMVDYAPALYRHGRAIMTLKLPEYNRETVIDHAFNILDRAYERLSARHLFHNRSEITVY
ncbi:MAG: SAM-dependent methyltransferase, partial [Candidatus Promineifilaceae bacterium]|nr:SAM-dependent methyltransferase [Candidatus Promineifilaceae bacterium]